MNLISQGVRARGGGTPGFRLSFTCSIFLSPEKDESRSRQNEAPKLMRRPDMKMPSNSLKKAPHAVNTAKGFPFVQPRLSLAFSEAFICSKLPHIGWLEKVQLNVLIYSGQRIGKALLLALPMVHFNTAKDIKVCNPFGEPLRKEFLLKGFGLSGLPPILEAGCIQNADEIKRRFCWTWRVAFQSVSLHSSHHFE